MQAHSAVLSPLATIQSAIAELYETPIDFQVEDFLITDLRAIGASPQSDENKTEEMLFVQETSDGLDISLFLDPCVVDEVNKREPETPFKLNRMNDYLLALEGVSHFQYLIWNAERKKSVTLFELELQAEIDKYILISILISNQRNGAIPKDLYGYLFDAAQFRQDLTPNVAKRYREASHYAGKYCRSLKMAFPTLHYRKDFLTEIRRFYRLPQNEKVRRIEGARH